MGQIEPWLTTFFFEKKEEERNTVLRKIKCTFGRDASNFSNQRLKARTATGAVPVLEYLYDNSV